MSRFGHAMRRAAAGVSAGGDFDPVTGVGWANAWWTEGPEFAAKGYSDTDLIDNWPDEVGSLDMTAVTTKRPTLGATSGPNSTPAVVSDGSNDIIYTATTPNLSQPFTVVVVGRVFTSGTQRIWFNANGNTGRLNLAALNASNFQFYAGTGGFHDGAIDTDDHLWVSYGNGASSAIEVDGSETIGNAGTRDLDATNFGVFAVDLNSELGGDVLASFVGTYNGNARVDAGWADFETWTGTHYGLTVA